MEIKKIKKGLWLVSNSPETRLSDRLYFKTKRAAIIFKETGELYQVGTTKQWGFYKFEVFPVYS